MVKVFTHKIIPLYIFAICPIHHVTIVCFGIVLRCTNSQDYIKLLSGSDGITSPGGLVSKDKSDDIRSGDSPLRDRQMLKKVSMRSDH